MMTDDDEVDDHGDGKISNHGIERGNNNENNRHGANNNDATRTFQISITYQVDLNN